MYHYSLLLNMTRFRLKHALESASSLMSMMLLLYNVITVHAFFIGQFLPPPPPPTPPL